MLILLVLCLLWFICICTNDEIEYRKSIRA